jgi:hypothetical protein
MSIERRSMTRWVAAQEPPARAAQAAQLARPIPAARQARAAAQETPLVEAARLAERPTAGQQGDLTRFLR